MFLEKRGMSVGQDRLGSLNCYFGWWIRQLRKLKTVYDMMKEKDARARSLALDVFGFLSPKQNALYEQWFAFFVAF